MNVVTLSTHTPYFMHHTCILNGGQSSKLNYTRVLSARVIFSGRKLRDRSRLASCAQSEGSDVLFGRQVRTAGPVREIHQLRITSYSAHRSSAVRAHERPLDTTGLLHFSNVTKTSVPLYDVRATSPPKNVVEDGVTDVIKIQITSSAKN